MKVHREQREWIETGIQKYVEAVAPVAVDEMRVTKALDPAWRYREPDGVSDGDLIGALQTSAWFTIDRHMLDSAMAGADPEILELPPLPFRRVAFDAQMTEDGRQMLTALISLGFAIRDMEKKIPYCLTPFIVVFEIEQGKLWDVMLEMWYGDDDTIRMDDDGRSRMGYHITPGGHTVDEDGLRALGFTDDILETDRNIGHIVWKTAVTAAHIVTASNVDIVRTRPHRKQARAWQRRRYRPSEASIYRVELGTRTERPEGKTDREYTCRWLVTGHYRHTPSGRYKHPRTGLPATFVKGHVKGPAGAPWKGRPLHMALPHEKETA